MTMMREFVTLLLSLTAIVSTSGAVSGDHQAAARHAFLKAAQQSAVAPKLRDNELQRKARRTSNENVFQNARQLYNYYYNNNNNNNNNNYNNNNYNNNQKTSIDWSTIGFDITQYSVRYMGCSSVLSYSDYLAKSNAASVLQAHRFAVFRLCPSFYCNPYSLTGCDSDYGEYAVDLDTYLQAIAGYDDEMIASYCSYCSVCNVTNSTYNGNACNSSACKNATSVCNKSATTYTASEYFSCTAVVSPTNGNTYYLGPHCSSDSYSIKVDVYSDKYCTNYVGGNVTVAEVLDGTIHQNALDYLPKKCVSCKESTNAWQVVRSDATDTNTVTEICEVLYEDSAKCNEHLTHHHSSSGSYSSSTSNDTIPCNFIHNLANGTYNEKGEIKLEQYTFNTTNWRNQAEYLKAASYARSTVSPWYIVGLTGVLLACTIMVSWACCLHRALARRNVSWRPKRGKNTDPTAISRQNSGIVMGRSRSGFGAASPLI